MNRKFYKDRAKAMLRGKWVIATLVALAYMLINGDSIIKINRNVSNTNVQDIQNILNNSGNVVKNFGILEYIPYKNVFGSFFARYGVATIIPVVVLIIIIGIVFRTLLLNPLIVGITRYFRLTDLGITSGMDDILFVFRSPHYKNVCKTMFFKDMYIFLWSLLLIIPGIIKSYEYKFIPWILSEYPQTNLEETFSQTRQMTLGRKLDLFILDLSFIGWALVVAITAGILGPVLTAYTLATGGAVYNSFTGRTEPEPY